MTPQLEKLLNELPEKLKSNHKVQEMVVHNLGYFLQNHSSYQICKKYYHDFDFRTDYWWKPEIRLLGKYYIEFFKDEFFPPNELRKYLHNIFTLAKAARDNGAFDFAPNDDAQISKDVLKRIGSELGKIIRAKPFDSSTLRDAHPRVFKDVDSLSLHLAEYVETFYKENDVADMNGTLINRIQFLPYYIAKTQDDLKAAIFFLGSFYTLFTATNAYQTGAAQNFGPILGNNSSKSFLGFVDKWMSGESIEKTGFKVLDSELREPQDKSEYVAILEVHGFSRLHEIPYVNKVVMKNYRIQFDLGNVDGKQVQREVGKIVRTYLSENEQATDLLSKQWDDLLEKAKSAFSLHYEPEKLPKKQKAAYESQLINSEYLEEYKKSLKSIGSDFSDLDKAQALLHLCLDANAYLEEDKAKVFEQITLPEDGVHYWSIAPGENADYWNEWQQKKLISIGWNDLGDLSKVDTLDDVGKLYKEKYKPENSAKNNILANFEFAHQLKQNDIVFVKNGRTELLGVGRVTSDYKFDKSEVQMHTRKVEWLSTGEWNLKNDKFAIKTLTDITEYESFVEYLLKLSGLSESSAIGGLMEKAKKPSMSKNTIFWGPPGTGKTYKLLRLQDEFKDVASSSDEIISWIQELGWWEVIAAAMIDFKKPVSVPELFNHEFVQAKIKQQSNKTPKNTIWGQLQMHTIHDSKTVKFERRQEPLIVDKLSDSTWELVGDWKDQLDDLIADVKRIRTEKGTTTSERFNVVTFHQSYSYEEFVEGIRPEIQADGSGVSYQVKDGVFKKLCQRALENPNKNYAIFIDEINRGNISKIFGELITLIEEDKRLGAPHEVTITLPYSGQKFGVPSNLYVIGTMNSVDRSIALVDMALRRRFDFIAIRPDSSLISDDGIKEFSVRSVFEKLNNKISVILGTEYQIGHSYFMEKNSSSIQSFKKVWFGNILPLLQEYLFDDWDKLQALVGDFVKKTEVKELENLSLPKFSFGSFVENNIPDNVFAEFMKKLE